jgi:hypothetical protein
MIPNYLQTFRRVVREQEERAAREREGREKSEISEKRVRRPRLNSLNSHPGEPEKPFGKVYAALERRCPDYVEAERWQQCVEDARGFFAAWGKQAYALGWTAAELFGLHRPPDKPRPFYSRLSRYDCTGLIWNLQGQSVVALTDSAAAIHHQKTGNVLIYRKAGKPAYGAVGDSLDDLPNIARTQ